MRKSARIFSSDGRDLPLFWNTYEKRSLAAERLFPALQNMLILPSTAYKGEAVRDHGNQWMAYSSTWSQVVEMNGY